MVREIIFFTSLNNKVTINTLNSSFNYTLVSTLYCSNEVSLSSIRSNRSHGSRLNIQQIHTPVS